MSAIAPGREGHRSSLAHAHDDASGNRLAIKAPSGTARKAYRVPTSERRHPGAAPRRAAAHRRPARRAALRPRRRGGGLERAKALLEIPAGGAQAAVTGELTRDWRERQQGRDPGDRRRSPPAHPQSPRPPGKLPSSEARAMGEVSRRYRQSVLRSAVTGELTRDWRERHAGQGESGADLLRRILAERRRRWEEAELAKLRAKGKTPRDDAWKRAYREPAPADTSKLPALPDGWVWASLPQLGTLGRGRSKHRPRNEPALYGGSYPFIQTGIVRDSGGRIRKYDQTYSEAGLRQSLLWPAGTLCITIAANIAETGILTFDACFPDSIVGFVAATGGVSTPYVEFFMRTAKSNLEAYAPATAQKNINLEVLFDVAVPLPPEAEQHLIVERCEELLSVADAAENTAMLKVVARRLSANRSSPPRFAASWCRRTRPMSRRACCWSVSGLRGRRSRRDGVAGAPRPWHDDRHGRHHHPSSGRSTPSPDRHGRATARARPLAWQRGRAAAPRRAPPAAVRLGGTGRGRPR